MQPIYLHSLHKSGFFYCSFPFFSSSFALCSHATASAILPRLVSRRATKSMLKVVCGARWSRWNGENASHPGRCETKRHPEQMSCEKWIHSLGVAFILQQRSGNVARIRISEPKRRTGGTRIHEWYLSRVLWCKRTLCVSVSGCLVCVTVDVCAVCVWVFLHEQALNTSHYI